MKETRTTAIICVPLVLKMIYDGIMKKAGRMPSLKRRVFYLLLAVSRALLVYNVRAGKILFKSVHDEFGGRLRGFVSGGAPLNPDIERDLNALGFRALQGYGLTETAPVISLNTYKHCKIGSVGRPIKGVEVKILKETGAADEGEIATRGPHVMKGYYKNPEKTANVIKNGWFLTGDIGYLDKDGFLHISGRLRNLIVLGTGKKVFPEEVEEVLGQSPYIKEICVLGVKSAHGAHRGHEEVSAVIVPNADMFNEADRNDEKRVRATISSEIARLSHALAAYKRIVSFEISFEELPKTATKKIRRNEVADRLGRMSARRRE
jgi:long-chain acyl-CoA synthetase